MFHTLKRQHWEETKPVLEYAVQDSFSGLICTHNLLPKYQGLVNLFMKVQVHLRVPLTVQVPTSASLHPSSSPQPSSHFMFGSSLSCQEALCPVLRSMGMFLHQINISGISREESNSFDKTSTISQGSSAHPSDQHSKDPQPYFI